MTTVGSATSTGMAYVTFCLWDKRVLGGDCDQKLNAPGSDAMSLISKNKKKMLL